MAGKGSNGSLFYPPRGVHGDVYLICRFTERIIKRGKAAAKRDSYLALSGMKEKGYARSRYLMRQGQLC